MVSDIPNGFTGFSQTNNFQYSRATAARVVADAKEFDEAVLDETPQGDRRWAWVEIDTAALRHNTMEVKRRLAPGCKLMAVVKADAYGHGAVRCAKAALNSGAEYLGVATVNEGIELRKANVGSAILVLSEPPAAAIPLLLHYRIMPSIYTPEFAIAYGEIADAHGMRAPYHLAINTGMNRIGVRFDEVMEFIMQVSFHRALDLVGTFTHFATADCVETLDFHVQAKRFVEALSAMNAAGVNSGLVHCDNSAALLRYPDTNFDMVRLGIALYGFQPCPETRRLIDLRPVMSVHARITDVRTVPMSEGVSYGLNYRSPGSVKICTVPVGYADGLRRALSGRTSMLLGGQRCPQVGNICMDQCMFEVDLRAYGTKKRLNPQIGDQVVLIGAQEGAALSIDDMAVAAGTIPHEITVGFAQRMPRIYI
ncbi:MAG: alanine racemase [Eggerthellaceae bacterium]